jgi:hypothetical protein
MSDRPTPETDALERCQYIYWGADGDALQKLRIDALDEMKSLARKLERERDEAREKLQALEKPATEDDSTPPAIRQMWANVDAKMIADGFQKGEYGLWHKKEGAQ